MSTSAICCQIEVIELMVQNFYGAAIFFECYEYSTISGIIKKIPMVGSLLVAGKE